MRFKLALDHAWGYFTVHAGQRMQLVNFWLVAMAFLAGATINAFADDKPHLALAAAVSGAVATWSFQRLDRRTSDLVKLAEAPLKVFQQRLASAVGVDGMRILERADEERRKRRTYTAVIRFLHTAAFRAFVVAALFALGEWAAD